MDSRLLEVLISDTFGLEQLYELFAHFQSLLRSSWSIDMPRVSVRSVEGSQIALELQHGLTSQLTRSSLPTSARSARTLEAAVSKNMVTASARHPHHRVVVDGQFLSLVDVADGMGNEFPILKYVVDLQVRDTGVVDATGQCEYS